jgi:hypothetical protein
MLLKLLSFRKKIYYKKAIFQRFENKMVSDENVTEERTLFNCVINDLIRYSHLCEDELHNKNLMFVVFSCEPFGFKFPDKKILQTLKKSKKLSKLKFQNRKAYETLGKIISGEHDRHSQEKIEKQYIEILNKNLDELKTLKEGEKLSKSTIQNKQALGTLSKLISGENDRHLHENIKKRFIEFLNKNQEELSPWCKQLLGIQELKQVLNSYMEEYNVGWNCCRIGNYPESLFYIELWIYYDDG